MWLACIQPDCVCWPVFGVYVFLASDWTAVIGLLPSAGFTANYICTHADTIYVQPLPQRLEHWSNVVFAGPMLKQH